MDAVYKTLIKRAVVNAQQYKDPQAQLDSISRGTSSWKRRGMRYSPKQIVLRIMGFRPQGAPWEKHLGGPASTAYIIVQAYSKNGVVVGTLAA